MNWTLFALFLSLIGLIVTLFTVADGAAKTETKKELSKWLLAIRVNEAYPWSHIFIAFFDNVFGEKMLSKKRIISSTIASVSTGIIINTIFYFCIEGYLTIDFIAYIDIYLDEPLSLFLMIIIINGIADFISIQETRWVLKIISRTRKPFKILTMIVLDFFLSLFILYLILLITIAVLVFIMDETKTYTAAHPFLPALLDVLTGFYDFLVTLNPHRRLLIFDISAFLYTNLMTSVWIYFFIISGFTIKAYFYFVKLNRRFLDLWNINEKPFLSLSIVSSLYIFIIGTVLSLVF